MYSLPDLDLSSSISSSQSKIRISPLVLSEIIETAQKSISSPQTLIFGALMGKRDNLGHYLVSSVTCLSCEYSIDEEGINMQLPKNYISILENHTQLYNYRTLGTFIVNPPQNQTLIGGIAGIINDFMRSKMETQIDNLVLTVEISMNSSDQALQAFKIIPNKYFKQSFANMIEIPVVVDYIPEENRHVYKDLLFYSLQKEKIQNFEFLILEKIIDVLKGNLESEELDEEENDVDCQNKKINLDLEVVQKLSDILKRNKRIGSEEMKSLIENFKGQNEFYNELLECFNKQNEISKKWIFEN